MEDTANRLLNLGFQDGHSEAEFVKSLAPSRTTFEHMYVQVGLYECFRDSGLLVYERSPTGTLVRFPHLTIAESLAASSIARRFDELMRAHNKTGSRNIVADLVKKPNRRQTLEFVPAYCRDPLDFVDVLLSELEANPNDGAILAAGTILRELRLG